MKGGPTDPPNMREEWEETSEKQASMKGGPTDPPNPSRD